ncbi:MAG: 16S rRNA (cytosine(1402)-N(4))-methyltransferase RsmH [Dysgonamonadaceae bacterium]|jgi:16S rRNA (cytosine1402-N4)-methyltransferase|nr:16S rRNA (cytosine(1402)-N(4))-methyltransferase RsmH [Dysgonamonadaceae bacterium]MDD3309237.1 16S rRNA (cytosine(1402)-N(4))-methyltransferase RsmH [Dysgonamonadaceae bacterium]MDD3899619.1 16S rRNA (cytosine(1402)-N(4))-methyltransferase RsmH [Dysgonamonadaceae bacterium]MDD4398132.1 16S rRNA (cytosine(1402)-N(4))-methyltransferase RsmH [Dysgonamonadaceae bacterium]MEA5081879.1 16S rRNA (cytosine(1402)-N(4))-methyltransferase RsmH [Dysgonamonadaceae bacterium]
MAVYHTPALLNDSIDGLNIQPSGVYVDVTFGGGGHSQAILKQLGKDGKLYAFDQDDEAYQNRIQDDRFTFVKSNFRYLKNFLRFYNEDKVDGILADLGVSSHHFDDSERGFSFRFEGNLDMRMNRYAKLSAADILNDYPEEKLANIFFFYGELKNARKIATAIVANRKLHRIQTVPDFVDIMEPFTYKEREKKTLAQAFQALRIEVNDEMGALSELLVQSSTLLKPGGRLCVISYHSLEDRLVKNFIRSGNLEGEVIKDFYGNVQTPFEMINRKVIIPDDIEQLENPRSRSAKLRIAQKK